MTPSKSAGPILIVDDQPQNVELLSAILEDEGYENLIGVSDPRQVIDHLDPVPAAVLLDIRMPHLNGLDILRLIKEELAEPFPPVLVLTADNDEWTRLEALELGALDYITKPFNQLEVIQRLSNLTSVHAFGQEQKAQNTELQQLVDDQTEQLRKLSRTDPATGLPNRRALLATLEGYLQSAHPCCLLAIDWLGFDDISRNLGHQVVEQLLLTIIGRLQEQAWGHLAELAIWDTSTAILLVTTESHAQLEQYARQIIELTAGEHRVLGERVRLQCKVGIARQRDRNMQPAELPREAMQAIPTDAAPFQFYSEQVNQAHNRRLQIKNELGQVNFARGLRLVYQPKICLEHDCVMGAEALIRWHHPKLGELSPGEFIPLAEATGDIHRLGYLILEHAVHQWQNWLTTGKISARTQLAVNLSALQLGPIFNQQLADLLAETGLDPARLQLEVTETSLASHIQYAFTQLQALQNMGIQVAIDDFGTGYSSLQYIQQLPADWIKIDRSFVQDMHQSCDRAFLLNAIIQLGQGLHYKVVAEGVETEQEAQWLKEHQCELVQGFYFARPLSPEDFLVYLEQASSRLC